MQQMQNMKSSKGSAIVLIVMSLVLLSILGMGMLSAAYGVRHKAIRLKNEAIARLAAEAGYEKAVFWMSQQQDMIGALEDGVPGASGALNFADGYCNYEIRFFSYVGSRPIYRITSKGYSGMFDRTVEVLVVQAISGWDMGLCRVPLTMRSTTPVYFTDGEVIDMPIHINDAEDSPDNIDINILGNPDFRQVTAMGESRYSDGGTDKYAPVMGSFDNGICFDQPDSKITDGASIASKIDRFRDSTSPQYILRPKMTAPIPSPHPAVQLEFYVEGNTGMVRITEDCTVRGYQRNNDNQTFDYRVKPGSSDVTEFVKYDIYAYHFIPENAEAQGLRTTQPIDATYVTQDLGGVSSEPGGQIYVDGDVIIGGDKVEHNGDQVVKGKITIVSTGNIWIADSVVVDGGHDGDGTPSADNPNILGLIAQGLIKVVDPGMSSYSAGGINKYPGPLGDAVNNSEYAPIGCLDDGAGNTYERHLPELMIVEAALTVGGGGWGAENVQRGSYGGRKPAAMSTNWFCTAPLPRRSAESWDW